MDLHWAFYDIGALAGIAAAVFGSVLLMWTLRDARRSALHGCTICLMVSLAVLAVCMAGMKLTA